MTVLDCIGLFCPRPIFETAKLARTLHPGAHIRVLADDPAFPEDMHAWCAKRGHTLELSQPQAGDHRADLVLGPAAP